MRHRWLALIVAALGISLPLAAQDEAPPAAAAPPAQTPPAAPPSAEPAATETLGAAEARRAAVEDEDVYTPTEEVPPDEEVRFPVDF